MKIERLPFVDGLPDYLKITGGGREDFFWAVNDRLVVPTLPFVALLLFDGNLLIGEMIQALRVLTDLEVTGKNERFFYLSDGRPIFAGRVNDGTAMRIDALHYGDEGWYTTILPRKSTRKILQIEN